MGFALHAAFRAFRRARAFPPRVGMRYDSIMLSVVLLSFDSFSPRAESAALGRERASRSLGSLVHACVEGLVADAVLVAPTGSELAQVADEAGCGLVEAATAEAGLEAALRNVRYADIFILCAGYAIERGFVEEARDALVFDAPGRARALRVAPDSLLTRLAPDLARPVGLLARKDAIAAAKTATLPALAKRLRAGEFVTRARRVP
jgi:hypothetical protein